MPKMNPLIKAKWVSALRSGEFKQGTMQLRTLDDKYCCLGVLCALAVREGVIDPPLPGVQGQFTDAYYFDGNKNYVPLSVRQWAGLEDSVGGYHVEGVETEQVLAVNNDASMPFPQIADIIEKHF